jgi:hypothetical protein
MSNVAAGLYGVFRVGRARGYSWIVLRGALILTMLPALGMMVWSAVLIHSLRQRD